MADDMDMMPRVRPGMFDSVVLLQGDNVVGVKKSEAPALCRAIMSAAGIEDKPVSIEGKTPAIEGNDPALADLKAAPLWRPMETAPTHDGAKVLLALTCGDDEKVVVEATYHAAVRRVGRNGQRITMPAQWSAPYDVWGGNVVGPLAVGWMPYPGVSAGLLSEEEPKDRLSIATEALERIAQELSTASPRSVLVATETARTALAAIKEPRA